jgi:hypothetical protein
MLTKLTDSSREIFRNFQLGWVRPRIQPLSFIWKPFACLAIIAPAILRSIHTRQCRILSIIGQRQNTEIPYLSLNVGCLPKMPQFSRKFESCVRFQSIVVLEKKHPL